MPSLRKKLQAQMAAEEEKAEKEDKERLKRSKIIKKKSRKK